MAINKHHWIPLGVLTVFCTMAHAEPATRSDANPAPVINEQLILPGASLAQAEVPATQRRLGKVTVTSRKKIPPLQTLKDVPASISVVSGEELTKQQTSNYRDILKRIGNVKWGGSSTNPTTTALAVRGVGYLGSGGALGFDGSVNTSVDDVPFILSNMAVFNSYYDLAAVDVARGPQGTRGGFTASLGKISFNTKEPTFEPEAEGSLTFGQLNSIITRGVIGGPIIENLLAWRGTFYREQSDGAFENYYYHTQSNGGNEVTYGNIDRTFGKVQFLLTPGESFRARLSIDVTPNSKEYGISSNGGFLPRAIPDYYDSLDPSTGKITYNDRPVDQAAQDTGKLTRRWFTQNPGYSYDGTYLNLPYRAEHYPIANDSKGAALHLDWTQGNYQLKSITGWRDYHFDFGSPNFSLPTPFDILVGPSSGLGYFKQTTQEFRLTRKADSSIDYQIGLFFADIFKTNGGFGRGNKYGNDAGAYYASKSQYDVLDVDGEGRYLLSNSLEGLASNSYSEKEDRSLGIYGNLQWRATEKLTLDIGLRASDEERRSDENYTLIYNQGVAPELNPVAINNVPLGGFDSSLSGSVYPGKIGAATAADKAIGFLSPNNTPAQRALADAAAKKYFGVASYGELTGAQARQLATAKSIRQGRISTLYGATAAEPFSDTLYTAHLSPSYAFTPNHTGYISWQYGEKAGVAQIVGATKLGGTSYPVSAEQNETFELGLKSVFLDQTLVLNTTLFYQDISDYIANRFVFDEVQTAINRENGDKNNVYITAIGNVPEVSAKGIEVDLAYNINNTSIRLSGAYNDSRYDDFKEAGKPLELGGTNIPYYDISGRRLPGVGPTSFNVFVEHNWNLGNKREIFANANYNYTSSYLTDPALSRYSKVDSYGLTDIGLGYGTTDEKFQISLVVKNVFDVEYGYQPLWNIAIPSTPRWAGITLSGKL